MCNPWRSMIWIPNAHIRLAVVTNEFVTSYKWEIYRLRQSLPWASCQIRKIAGAHAPGMPETFSPPPRVSDLGMHHGTCVTHVPWCMPWSLTSGFLWSRRPGGNVPGIPGACATHNFTYLERGPWRDKIHGTTHDHSPHHSEIIADKRLSKTRRWMRN